MLKNIMKRTVSTFLALIMVVTSVCFFDLSGLFPTADAATSSSSYTTPDVYIVVPETFYMQASVSTTTSVQYYVNDTLSGTTVSPDAVRDATTGKIWFNAASGSVTDLKYSILGTNKTNVPMTPGSSSASLSGVTLDAGMDAATTRTLEWVFTCKIDGRPAEYHAYTVAYAPYYTPVGAAVNTKHGNAGTQMQGITWISGVHSYTANNVSPASGDNDNWIATDYHARTAWDGSWNRPLAPMIESITAPTNNDQNITDWLLRNSSSGACPEATFTLYDVDKAPGNKKVLDIATQSHIANVTVDISRNQNFSTIPNLTTGFFVSDLKRNNNWMGSYGGYMANYAGSVPGVDFWYSQDHYTSNAAGYGSFTATSGVDTAYFGGNSDSSRDTRDFNTDSIPFQGVWNRATPTAVGTTTNYIHTALCCEFGSNWIYASMYLPVNVTAVDKSTLRSLVFDKQKQANTTSLENNADLGAKLKAACAVLGDPTATQSAVDSATIALYGATSAGTTREKTTVVRHVNARTGEPMPGNNSIETVTTDLYDAVTVTPNSYTGYTLTGQYRADAASLFDMDSWNGSLSGGKGSVQSKDYNASTKTLTLTVTGADKHTADTRSTTDDVRTSGFDYFAVDPNTPYLLTCDYAGTGNGDVGILCYDADGHYLGYTWLHTVSVDGMFAATGSTGSFRSESFVFCPAMYVRPSGNTSYITQADAARTRYISLAFGGYPNNDGYTDLGPAATSANPLTCVFRNVQWKPMNNLFDMDAWKNSDSGVAGNRQTITGYDTATRTLTLTASANDTYTHASRDTEGDIRTTGYYFFDVDAYNTYTVNYQYAGTGNGDIGVWCYDKDGHYLGYAWFHSVNYMDMMAATGSNTKFVPGSFEFCPATYTRPAGNSSYIIPSQGVKTKYIALTFGGYPNPSATSTPVTNIFRGVYVTANAPKTNLFDSAAWAASSCAANGSGVSSVNYTASTDTITVVNSGTDTYTKYTNSNILNSGYYYIPVDPDGTYTLDFDYASATRAQVGVICYDANGDYIGDTWLFDSLKATGDADTYVHHTEVICPQTNHYLAGDADRFDVRYIAITFGNFTESGQSAATCNFRNVAITESNELFDMAQWAFRSANRYKDGADQPASDLAYDSATKTLTITSHDEDTISAYADSSDATPTNLLTTTVTAGGFTCPFYYTPVQGGATYTFEGEYAGTGNGDLGVIEYKADGTINQKNWLYNSTANILDATGSDTDFEYFTTSVTTQADTKYIALCFGGYPNSTASTTPVTCVFRDVKMHLTSAITVPNEDSVFTFYYRPNMYNVEFDGNGSSSGTMADQKHIYDTSRALSANQYQRVFHVSYNANGGDMATPTAANLVATSTFAGWATTANGDATYTDQQSVRNLTSTDHATVTLYAAWTPGTLTLPQVTRGGYTFEGWFTAATGGTNVGTATYAPTEDNITLYAHWMPNTFTLTFDENSVGTHANMPEDMEVAYDSASDPLPAPKAPNIDGWHFLGWAAYDPEGGIGDEEENGTLRVGGRRSATRSGESDAEDPTELTTVTYYEGDVIPAETVNDIIADVGDGGEYTLYAVWVKSLKTEFVDYYNGTERTRLFTEDVYNGASSSLLTSGITQGAHTDWVAAGWTTSREKGAAGSALPASITLSSADNLFDMTAWWASPSHVDGNHQTMTYHAGSETLTSVGSVRDVMSVYNENNLLTQNFNRIAVDPYKTYKLGVEYAGSGNVSGQVGLHFYDEDGNFLACCWLFTGSDSGYGDPHRGGDYFGDSTGLTDFHQAYIDICPMTFESSYLSSFTEAQRESVAYIALTFGNYSDDNTVSASNETTVIYRNVTFTENRTYYGVYTQEVALTYDENTTDTVGNMPTDPAPQDRVANSALGFGDDDILNPTFTLSNNALTRTGYTYEGWNTDPDAVTGQRNVEVEIDEDTTYYAIWTAHTYTITFNENGVGTAANMPADVTAVYDAPTGNLPAPTSTTVDGWAFQGWAVSPDLTTVAHAAGAPISAADIVSYYTADGATFTLYAVWTKTITATFIHYPNGTHTSVPVQKLVYNGADASILAADIPTQGTYTGWDCDGWTTSQAKNARGSAVSPFTTAVDVTYYGVYTKQITLTYDANTDDPSVANMPAAPAAQTRIANSYYQSFSSDNTTNPTFTVSSQEPTRTGYDFGGWGNNTTDSVGSVTGSLELTESKILYAVWALSDYTLTVETTVGGSVAGQYISGGNLASISVASNSSADYTIKFNYTVSSLVPTAATGYTFTRWDTQDLTLADATTQSLTFNMPAGDVTLTAVFTPNPYTIVYHHESQTKTQNCTYDQTLTLFTNGDTETATQTAFSKTGYTFDCWVDSNDTTYAAGFAYQTAPNFTSVLNGQFDLYASWTQNSYNITYVLQGGSADANRPTSATFDDAAFSVSAPTKNGYTFTGWTVSGLDTTTAMWGTTSANVTTPLTLSTTKCVNGESGSVYFKNLASTDGAIVTLTATWEAKEYVLRYASSREDNWEVVGGTYDYDEDVTVAAVSVLTRTYPGWTFDTWTVGFDENGATRDPGATFNLSTFGIVFSSLDLDENNNPTVYLYAEWTARNYRIVYNMNGYSVSDIKTGGRTNNQTWRTGETDTLSKDDTMASVHLYGAYSESSNTQTNGVGSYFYLDTGTEVRFGLGWSFTSGAIEPSVGFATDLTIANIPDAALTAATAVQGETNLYEVTLYIVWSADYKPFENKVSQFQQTYMTYAASGNTTLRGADYTGANAANVVYTNAPESAKLPAVSTPDNAYKLFGSEANEIWNNNSSAADYALYDWVAGPIGNDSAWASLPASNDNDFTAASLTTVNGNITDVLAKVIYNPSTQFGSGTFGDGTILSQTDESEDHILQDAANALDVAIRLYVDAKNNVANAPTSSALLTGLVLKDADLDYRLTSAEMLAINSTYGEACPYGEHEGMGYRPDEDTIDFLSEVFQDSVEEMYPECETDENGRHHSFNSLIDLANSVFALYGFDPSAARDDSIDYFMDGTLMSFNVDPVTGFVINPDCPYTTESVYRLFDLIYGRPSDGTYKTLAEGATVNRGNVALYYQVKDALGANANVKLKKPSQEKLNAIVTTMAYGYHSLELDKADYTEFQNLFWPYFNATWGTALRAAGYTINQSNQLATFAEFFEPTSYSKLSAFMSLFFSAPGVLLSTYEKVPAVEQNLVNGKDSGWARTFKNSYINANSVDLSAFNYAERPDENEHVKTFAERMTYDEENHVWNLDTSDTTLCSLFCDAIDSLVPAAADYTAVFQMIANSIEREVQTADYTETRYMIDTSTYSTSTFYPSAAAGISLNNSNYNVWFRDYAKADAWGSIRTQADNKPAYDTEWLSRYYTASSVSTLATAIQNITWIYNKLQQPQIDGMTNGVYNNGTVCASLQAAINGLTPKQYIIEFYKDLYDEDNDPEYLAHDYVSATDFKPVGNMRMPYRYGMSVQFEATPVADPASVTKTFYAWNTLKAGAGTRVSSASSRYITDFTLNDTLLGTPSSPNTSTIVIVPDANNEVFRIKLYAEWVENVTIRINMADGGSVDVTMVEPNGAASTTTTFTASGVDTQRTAKYGTTLTFGAPSRTGYQFSSWSFQMGANNTASTFNDDATPGVYVYTFGYFDASQAKTDDTLTAVWEKNTYTVAFDKNHNDATGSMSPNPQTFRYDTPQALTLNGFERTGYRFIEWTTNADGTGDSYTDGEQVSNLTTVQNGVVTLYAQWDYADFTLTFVVGEDGTWNGWPGSPTHANTQTKTITYEDVYDAADTDGKTWPNDPIGVMTVSGSLTIRPSFVGWFTDPTDNTTMIDVTSENHTQVTCTDLEQTVYAVFETTVSTQAKNQIQLMLTQRNANDYTMESMKDVDDVLIDLLYDKVEVTPAVLASLNTAISGLELVSGETGDSAGDATPPAVTVLENKQVLEDALDNHTFTADAEDIAYMQSEDTGEIHYVFPGKAYYTYYCYTNSTAPAIMVSAQDIAGSSGRVSYPVTMNMRSGEDDTNSSNLLRTRSGLVRSGWMNYTQDVTDPEAAGYNPNRTAGYHIGTNEIANPYRNDLQYFGMNYDGTGYGHYMYEQYILLKPTFDASQSGKQYALYTFEVKDDSVGDLAAGTSNLAGGVNTTTAATNLTTTPNEDVSPTNTVTIFVEYYNTMSEPDADAGGQIVNAQTGIGTHHNNGMEVYNEFHENGYENNKWVNVDYLYRNAGGIQANNEFISPLVANDGIYPSYVANDPVFGQNDVGSFYYLMSRDDPATALYWEAYDAYILDNPNDNDARHNARVAGAQAALDEMADKVLDDMKNESVRARMDSIETQAAKAQNGDYIHWPYATNTQWSTQFYAPAHDKNDILVYVHIYDRWGNHYTNILQRDLQDTKEGVAAAMGRGQVTISETGGSGVQGVAITELNTNRTVPVSGMTDDGAWNVVNNQFTITGLPEGSNNYQYTMTITDNAGNTHSENFRAASDGSVVVTVNDETMGGQYAADAAAGAAAADAPQPGAQGSEPQNGVSIGEAEEIPLTTMAIEEVQPNEITIDTIPEAQINGGAAPEEDRPDLYTFTLNEVYTVNLFADSQRDYTVTLKSTAGGIVKAYVNGEFSPAKGGKVFIPSGSQVQIRVSSRAGYELQSLVMIYPDEDNTTVNLVGAYNAEINDDVTIKAVFVQTPELLRLSAENGAISGKTVMYVSPYSRVAAVADEAPEGKVFAYWAQNGDDDVPVSYDEIYSFIATSSVDLKAIYADAQTAQTAGIVMDAASPTHVNVVNDMYTLSYSGKITVPEGAQIEEFGLVLTNQSSESCTKDNLQIGQTVNGSNVVKLVGQTLTEEGQCKINVNNVKPGQTRTGRLYLIVKLADGRTQTLYSNTWSELNTPAA